MVNVEAVLKLVTRAYGSIEMRCLLPSMPDL